MAAAARESAERRASDAVAEQTTGIVRGDPFALWLRPEGKNSHAHRNRIPDGQRRPAGDDKGVPCGIAGQIGDDFPYDRRWRRNLEKMIDFQGCSTLSPPDGRPQSRARG
jgi:hypothetical protein